MKMSTTMETDAEKEDTSVSTSGEQQERNSENKTDENEKLEEITDFDIPMSDTENENKSENVKNKDTGFWEPPTGVIVELYEKLDKEGILELDWKCPKRKTLEEEAKELEESNAVQIKDEVMDTTDETKEEEPTEFDDFDEFTAVTKTTAVTPRRTLGSAGREGKGSSKKRVALLDKVFTDMIRHKKMDDEGEQLPEGEKESTSDSTPHRTMGRQFRMRHRDFLNDN